MLCIDRDFLMTYIEDEDTSSKFYNHTESWKDCTDCDLTTLNKVYCRGSLPCEVLFIGEAPGFDEDKECYPFVGRAGEILQAAIDEVFEEFEFTWAITNTVLCLPVVYLPASKTLGQKVQSSELRKPLMVHLKACSQRLEEFIGFCKPKVVVLLGKTAQSKVVYNVLDTDGGWLASHAVSSSRIVETPHPAYIARRGGLQSADFQRLILHITKAVESIL